MNVTAHQNSAHMKAEIVAMLIDTLFMLLRHSIVDISIEPCILPIKMKIGKIVRTYSLIARAVSVTASQG